MIKFAVVDTSTAAYNLAVQYEPVPTLMSSSSDKPQYIPEEYHHLITWGTMAILASLPGVEDWDVANAWEARFRSGVNEMITTLGLVAPENYPSLAMVRREAQSNAQTGN